MKNKDEWFKEWFDSPYYHLLYWNRSDSEAKGFINNICAKIALPKNSKVLDLACGKGRHSKHLHSIGYNVDGIDLSKNSIDFANQSAKENLHFFIHDMRENFRINYFDCVMNLFTSIGYFTNTNDNFKVIEKSSQSLKRKGWLIIDFLNATKTINNLVANETKKINNVEFSLLRRIDKNEIIKDITINHKNKTYNFQERVTALKLNDFESYFRDSSLNLIHLFGDYDLSNFDELTSNRLIMVCEKK